MTVEPSPIGASLGLGGANLGNHRVAMNSDVALALIEEAWACGVRSFDTAPHYGLGLSERRLGDALASHPRDALRISTKVGRRLVDRRNPECSSDDEGFVVPADRTRVWDFSPGGIRSTLEASLGRLGMDRVDVAYLHDPERFDLDAALRTGIPALARLKDEGLVGAIGVASMQLDALIAAASTGAVDEIMAAGRVTVLDQAATDTLMPVCAHRGVAVIAAAVFNGGFLTEPPTTSSTFDYEPASREMVTLATRFHALCSTFGVPARAVALQYPLRHPAVRAVVVGTDALGQIGANARMLSTPIPDALWCELAKAMQEGTS